jgi:hypothetical protein
MTATYGALLRQFKTEHFVAAVLKAKNPWICVHHSGPGNQPCKESEIIQKCQVSVLPCYTESTMGTGLRNCQLVMQTVTSTLESY